MHIISIHVFVNILSYIIIFCYVQFFLDFSTWVIMNKETRRLSKIPDQVREELTPFYLNRIAIPTDQNDSEKIDKLTDKTAERIRSGLAVSIKTQSPK